MSESTSSENYDSKGSIVNWLVRSILYGSVFASVFLPSYVAIERNIEQSLTCKSSEYLILSLINQIHCHRNAFELLNDFEKIKNAQLSYYLNQEKEKKFPGSLAEAGIKTYKKHKKIMSYQYRIIQPMIPRQNLDRLAINNSQLPITMAIAQNENDKFKNAFNFSYYNFLSKTIGSSDSKGINAYIVCEMIEYPFPKTMPIVVNGKFKCPPGSIKLSD